MEDASTPDLLEALPRDVRMIMGTNDGPRQTCFRLALGVAFIAFGITYRRNRDRRVMTVLGIMWIPELGVRWGTELAGNYYWNVNTPGSHPLVKEYLRDSRLTTWCKRCFGWPKLAIAEEDRQRERQEPYYNRY
jgi:hypothetical protein